MKLVGLPSYLFVTFVITVCTAEILNAPTDDRYFYFAGDDETEITLIDSHEPIDEDFVRDTSGNPHNNGYWLFTRSNPVTPQILRYNDTKSLKNSNFHKDKMIVFLVHGWRGSSVSTLNEVLTEAFLQHQDLNVIVFDWSVTAARNYLTARKGVLSEGRSLGQFIAWLQEHDVSLQRMHLVGHSLGGHLVGNAGRYLDGAVRRITALDPAAPLWRLKDSGRLNYTDAQYVEVIHTNSYFLGYEKPIGDADFYPNGGTIQPGCGSSTCSHARAYELMTATVLYNRIKAHKCSSMRNMRSNTCDGEIELMGNSELRTKSPGIYRVNTDKAWPYDVSKTSLTISYEINYEK